MTNLLVISCFFLKVFIPQNVCVCLLSVCQTDTRTGQKVSILFCAPVIVNMTLLQFFQSVQHCEGEKLSVLEMHKWFVSSVFNKTIQIYLFLL